MGPNGSGKSTLSAVLTGNPLYEVTEGEAWFNGKNILEMKPEDRAHEGLFLSFQYPVEIPGVSMTNFLKAAVNEKRKYQGQPQLSVDFPEPLGPMMACISPSSIVRLMPLSIPLRCV